MIGRNRHRAADLNSIIFICATSLDIALMAGNRPCKTNDIKGFPFFGASYLSYLRNALLNARNSKNALN